MWQENPLGSIARVGSNPIRATIYIISYTYRKLEVGLELRCRITVIHKILALAIEVRLLSPQQICNILNFFASGYCTIKKFGISLQSRSETREFFEIKLRCIKWSEYGSNIQAARNRNISMRQTKLCRTSLINKITLFDGVITHRDNLNAT